MSDQALDELLRVARSRNLSLNITGMLIYSKDFFVQVLEGDKPDIDAVYFESIVFDPRHAAPYVMDESEIESRSFPDWTMGFRRLSRDAVAAEPGFFDLSTAQKNGAVTAEQKNFALRMIYSFI
ncbi:hypothetical protein LPB72_17020 [Hydrogenophaga crassostreae]|uniref:BLUF domain-containing protein n=2 Tax=Hydrogenophaga crassostreae TaxID=1763535 RepID=A0A162VVJ8_9BURK|nr:hypothetical protein LPB072_07540 [Hydrogenophaga crassostreae]OAD40589.1 hypothetical protein LPB72_17020 [Hydrogenophaga crassostreae]